MKKWRVGVFFAILLLAPLASYVEPARSAGAGPPVTQPLVREGDFAVGLAQGLLNGDIADENEAESKLASIGVTPRNGWISDYPVTPDILGELKESAVDAADSGRLSLPGFEASAVVGNVSAGMGLYVQTATGVDAGQGPPGDEAGPNPAPEPVEDYYPDNGPPVVSYYAPPDDYAYLYAWVPCPFWWTGYWFPGFFILNDFDIAGNGHHHRHGPCPRITNHVVDRVSGRTARINPVTRSARSSAASGVGNAAGAERGSANSNSATQRPAGSGVVFRPPPPRLSGGNAASGNTYGGSPVRPDNSGNRARTDIGRPYGRAPAAGGRGGYSGAGRGGSSGGRGGASSSGSGRGGR